MARVSSYETDRDGLIYVAARVTGPRGMQVGRFAVDTGAGMTMLDHGIAEAAGYSARDGEKPVGVRSAIGREVGYTLRVARFAALGFAARDFEVEVFDDDYHDLRGLMGMNFLSRFNFEVRSAEHRLRLERIGT